jgi:glycosyltransferase involved in cell wall biosynthesis
VTEWGKSWWYRQVFARAAGVVAWSQWAADSLSVDYGVEPEKTFVAHPGAPTAFFGVCRPAESSSRRPRILFVGGDFERKGGEQLLDAFQTVSKHADLVVVSDADIVVPDGVIQEKGVLPASERLIEAYASSDIFCLPTLADCTPVVLGEAMAAGLAVIATRVGSNAETITDGETGLLVDPGDTSQLAEALARLVHDDFQRRELGANARQVARQRFHADANATAVFNFLEGLT